MPLCAQRSIIAPTKCLDFDHMPPNRRFSVAPAADEDLPCLATMTAGHIPNLQGTYQALKQVQRYSRSVLAVRNKDELIGCFAALLLNDSGFEQLLRGSLSMVHPSPSYLVRTSEAAAAIYVWALCTPGMAVGAAGNIMQWLRQETYVRADLYARAGTPKGKAFMIRAGFRPLAGSETSLWVYRRTQ